MFSREFSRKEETPSKMWTGTISQKSARSVLQCVMVCYSVTVLVHCVALSVLQRVAVWQFWCSVLHTVAISQKSALSVLQFVDAVLQLW